MTTENQINEDALEKMNAAVKLINQAHDIMQEVRAPHLFLVRHDITQEVHQNENMRLRFMAHICGYRPGADLSLSAADLCFGLFEIIDSNEVPKEDLAAVAQVLSKHRELINAKMEEVSKKADKQKQ